MQFKKLKTYDKNGPKFTYILLVKVRIYILKSNYLNYYKTYAYKNKQIVDIIWNCTVALEMNVGINETDKILKEIKQLLYTKEFS